MEIIEVHAEITNKCILECKHCSSLANRTNEELSLEKLIKFIEQLSKNKRVRLTLTGGEPLLRFNLEELLESLKKLNREIELGLFTTGLINEGNFIEPINLERIRRLKELGLNFVFISIYSNEKKYHDEITQVNLSFDKTIIAIKNFIEEGIETNINLPLMKFNIINLEKIINYLKSIGINEIRLLRLINHGNANDNWQEIGITEEEQLKAIKMLESYSDKKITFGGFLEVMSCQYINNEKRCLAGRNKLYIDNYGDVYPCGAVKLNKKMKICNIYEEYNLEKYNKSGSLCLAYN